jgi:CelD/BcsL family acetyltransferase involved in cellulose biosynthesis
MEFATFEDFDESLRDEWNALLLESVSNVPFLQFDYLKTWWEHLGGGEWQAPVKMALITARNDNQLVGIAPLFVAGHEGRMRLLFLGSIEISDFLDLIVRENDEQRFIRELLPYIQATLAPKYGIDYLDLYNLLEESPSVDLLQGAASEMGWGVEKERLQRSPFIQLPGDWEAYLGSIDKKQRHEIRRKMRRASESEFPVDWFVVQEAGQLESAIETFFNLMMQEKDKQQFLTPPMRAQLKALMQTMFNAGALQLAFLTVNGSPAAGLLNFDYNNRIWSYNSGLGADYTDYSPGWVLLGHLLKWANENNREAFDFMRGDEDYKYRFGAKDRYIVRLKIDLPQ